MNTIHLLEVLKKISPLSSESEDQLATIIENFTVPKNKFIVAENEICQHIYFLKKGLVRIFYKNNNKEVTEWLALDEEFFVSIGSFYTQKPSHLMIQCVEPSVILGLPHDKFMQLCQDYHDIETLHRRLITNALLIGQERMKSIQFESAQQRYENLVKHRPDIIQRVSLTFIASFLGITLETLSRIRGK